MRKSLAKVQELQLKEALQEGSRHRQFRHKLKPKLRTADKAQDEAVNIGVKLPQIDRSSVKPLPTLMQFEERRPSDVSTNRQDSQRSTAMFFSSKILQEYMLP